jgi:hypothetical protein
MRTRFPCVLALPLLVLAATASLAQVSTSFALEESTFNAGGHPADGVTLLSTSYSITLDSIGDGIAAAAIASGSYSIDSGFVPAYPPPTEVQGLSLPDLQNLIWLPNATATGGYNLYRGLLSSISGLSYGSCAQQNIPAVTTTDLTAVPGGDGYFFLVTAENTLDEDGTKGKNSAGAQRLGTVCP